MQTFDSLDLLALLWLGLMFAALGAVTVAMLVFQPRRRPMGVVRRRRWWLFQ